MLGKFDLTGIPPAPKEALKLNSHLKLMQIGILNDKAEDMALIN
jgi:hypothetical protein